MLVASRLVALVTNLTVGRPSLLHSVGYSAMMVDERHRAAEGLIYEQTCLLESSRDKREGHVSVSSSFHHIPSLFFIIVFM